MRKKIRALLLSAGFGTRLRPITNSIPKCLVDVGGKPLLAWWLESLEKIGCEAVLINTHYLHEKVLDFISSWEEKGMKIETTYEENLLGTAGTLLVNKNFFIGCDILMIHTDNFTSMDLNDLLQANINRPLNCLLTMLTFESSNPQSCGIVITDKENIVQNFFEKELSPPSNIANGAIYMFNDELIDFINQNYSDSVDFSNDVIPNLMGRIFTYHTNEIFIDIGTPENLKIVQSLCK